MQRDSIEHDGLAIEKDARRGRVDPDLSQSKARVEVVDALVVRVDGNLQHIERGQARAPEVGGADRERRGDPKYRVAADVAEADVMVEQRLGVSRDEACRLRIEAIARIDLRRPELDLDPRVDVGLAPVLEDDS